MTNITPRRREVLETVARLCERKKGPVHYDEVAGALGISKWTAYDALKGLEREGLVCGSYAVKRDGSVSPGRSRLSFWAPRTSGPQAIEEHLDDESKVEVRTRVERWAHLAGPRERSFFSSCATFVIALLLLLEAFASPSLGSVRAAVASVPSADVGLLVFAGGAAAALVGKAKSIPAVKRVLEASNLYSRALGLLTEESKEVLFKMLKQELGMDDESR